MLIPSKAIYPVNCPKYGHPFNQFMCLVTASEFGFNFYPAYCNSSSAYLFA